MSTSPEALAATEIPHSRKMATPTTHPERGPLRVAVIGCGAVTERFHLPAMRSVQALSIEALVDRDENRAKTLAAAYRVPRAVTDVKNIIGAVDAAIVALPHSMNARIATELLSHGVPVLVEKPMALTVAEAADLISLAERCRVSLSVGYTRRFGYGIKFARKVLKDGLLGTITGVSVEDGYPFDWKSAAPEFRLTNNTGGGVLLDIGTHVFDMLLFWFGTLSVKSCLHDSWGGVEINAIVDVGIDAGVRGTIELSWERTLRNSAIIEGTAGRLEIEWYRNNATAFFCGNTLCGSIAPNGCQTSAQTFDMMFVDQLQEWADALRGGAAENVLATGADAAEVLRLVGDCRDRGGIWQYPWSAALPDKREP